MSQRHVPGVLVVAGPHDAVSSAGLASALATVDSDASDVLELDGLWLASWGLDQDRPTRAAPLMLSRTNWSRARSVPLDELAGWLGKGHLGELRGMLPPFAALGLTDGGVRVAADAMGFRQLYLAEGEDWAAVSTSARVLAAFAGAGLDETALLLQSQLGWQLAQRTVFAGVTKLRPGEAVVLRGTGLEREPAPQAEPATISLDDAVQEASALLRQFLESYLEENAEPTLQLTGGQDSRLLLSAIPRKRRRGLRVMTLGASDTPDAAMAAQLAQRFGMLHTTQSVQGLAGVSAEDSFLMACAAATRLDCMSDPLARAATLWAEQHFDQGARLSGLGGEIARGFYYTGRVDDAKAVTRQRVERLAKWRMFANEPVETASLSEQYARDAMPVALELVHQAVLAGGCAWYSATDELYYGHRMQRWAGLGETAVCFDRTLTNPMLDARFLAIARALHPRDKANSRFLARLQLALDSELASVPLDNRPPPRVYAEPGVLSLARQSAAKLGLTLRKVRQRLQRTHRPPPGAAAVSTKVSEHLRRRPDLLDPVRKSGVFSERWLDNFTTGRVEATSSTLALVINVLVADEAPRPPRNRA